ncbi:MAG: type II toxin-antitoxin system Phd/YefM family antitoxin [Anaerolineaceae bacterium]|nr:type II toxin-antitoxin system Phd/YefM family antitoxin [Anaerolineaceae bacterium]
MNSTTITNFRKNIYGMIERTVRYNEPVNILTREGNAVLISEEEYNNLLETLYLNSVPGMHEKLIDGLNTPLEETVSEDSVVW